MWLVVEETMSGRCLDIGLVKITDRDISWVFWNDEHVCTLKLKII